MLFVGGCFRLGEDRQLSAGGLCMRVLLALAPSAQSRRGQFLPLHRP